MSHIASGNNRGSESENQLCQQWDFLSKRLSEVERGLTLADKKISKIQKKLNSNLREINQFNTQITDEILKLKQNLFSKQDIEQTYMKQYQSIERDIKNAYSHTIQQSIQSLNEMIHQKNQNLEYKLKGVYDQSKAYIDRAVYQLKQILKKYVKEQGDLERKIQRSSRENSPSLIPRSDSKNSLNKSKSATRFFDSSQKSAISENNHQHHNANQRSRQKIIKEENNPNNRVSYLRQKLKEFEKINKKYEVEAQKPHKRQQKDDLMKKMKGYREYLEQSQSQFQPSNILNYDDVSSYSSAKKNNHRAY